MKKICKSCNTLLKNNLDNFYKKERKRKDGSVYIYFEPRCKKCFIKKANKISKKLSANQIKKYAFNKNKARKTARRKDRAKQLGITYENWCYILDQRNIISTKRNQLDKLKKRLNKFIKPKKYSMYYKNYYQVCSKEWQELTKDKPQENTLIYRIKYKYDTNFNLKERLRNQLTKQKKKYPNLDYAIRQAVSNNQNTKYLDILGYKKEQLKSHLEKQFTKDMTWKSFRNGDIHIDHIKPQSLFNLKDINEIKQCWSLNNLQPLWAKDNIIKSNKYKEK